MDKRKQKTLFHRIKLVAHYLTNKIRVTDVILFGSQVTGKTCDNSDIDLAIISPDLNKYTLDAIIDILVDVKLKCDMGVEIHPFNYDSLKHVRETNFLGHIIKTGRYLMKNNRWLV